MASIRPQTTSSTRGEGRSFLKWAGGKSRYADQLIKAAPAYDGCYWEPFMGSAAVFFEGKPTKAVLSDANPDLVVCFCAVARDPEAVMAQLDTMPNTREYFEVIRRQDVENLSEIQCAARVIYLNKTSFRGLWRVNKKGQYNVPYGNYDRPYYNRDTLLLASRALNGVEVRHGDFAESLKKASAGDWIYLDPPYIPEGGFSDFKRYTSGQFHEADHQRLAEAMWDADRRGIFLMLTNSDTDTTRTIFKGFNVRRMATRRDINLQSAKRGSWDLVFTNYEPKTEP
ncbi:Methyl-directed repair DNA adenine methylase [Actinokineospora spheciospongiae]|uniref:Site-specific DNA-methyltransferase (adenine-specific) n=1 Tax=Actinokineospora spheciospongiae TaxID=909613 RepID=W7IT41_9PSEU|nr:Dam family site-specific DNA-(adenine-N6)-methyltransferase [Actinokineospora spheciospongiae]EWC63543.1 Methyl-directed repair DNA adenine methylase [Actinokineospora spheciospongiae]PWW64292.1 DNA adenine methylase Dam [Actinokineospora spheciospongiae]